MSQDFTDLCERRAATEHLRGERMTKQMGAPELWMEAGPGEGPMDDIADGSEICKSLPWSPQANEDPARWAVGSYITQIVRQCLADILWYGKAVVPDTLPPNHKFSIFPVYVIEFHMGYFSGTEAETC
jgi:hypothetical protein